MALRARELYYFVRIGNYASRPLRALQADFSRLGAAGDMAATRLERFQLEQARLARSIALRQAAIPAMQQVGILRAQEQQATLQRANLALANKRAAIDRRIAAAEYNVNKAIEQGNFLAKERVNLEAKQVATTLRARRGLLVQEATLASQIAQANRTQAMIPAQRRIATLETFRAQAQRATIAPLLTGPQRRAALAGRISTSPDIAKMQTRFIAAEKAIQNADLAMKRLGATEQTLVEKQQILARSNQRLIAAEKELQISTQQQRLALDRLDAKTIDNTAVVDRYRREIQQFTVQLQELTAEERKLSLTEQRLIAQRLDAAASIAKENEALGLEVSQLQRVNAALIEQQGLIRRHRLDQVALGSRALSDLGRTAQYAGGLTLIAFALMGRAAAKFRTQVTYAATQVGNNLKEVRQAAAGIGTGILAQMRLFPATAEEMTKASYDVYSSLTLQGNAQQQTAEGLKVLSIFNRAAVAGQAKLIDVTSAGITILNQFGKTADGTAVDISKLNKFMNQAFAAVRFGRETFTEFTTTLAQAAPAAKAAHQSFADMAGTLAFLTRRLPVRQASVAYARLLEILQRSSKGLAEHGVAIRTQAGFMRPLDQIIGDIAKHFPRLAQGRRFVVSFFKEITAGTGTGTMGTIQARRALVFLVQQYRQYQGVLKQTTSDQNEFWKSFRALRATPEVKWKIFINQLRALSIEIGQYVIPSLIKLFAPIARAVKWFEGLSTSTKKQVATWTVWLSALLLVGGTAAVVIGSITRIVATLAIFGDKLVGASGATKALGSEAGAITAIMARRLGLVAAVAILIKYHHEVGIVIDKLGGLKAIAGIVATYFAVRMVMAFALAAAASVRSAITILASETTIGAGAEAASIKVAGLRASLLALGKLAPIAVTIGIYEIFHHAGGITNFLKNVVPGYKAFGDLVDRHIGFLRRLDEAHGLVTQQELFPPHITESQDRYYSAILKKAEENRKRLAKLASRPISQQWEMHARGGPAQLQNLQQIQKRIKETQKAQEQHNKTVQEWINLAIKANRIAREHPKNLQDQIRAAQIMNEIQKKFTGAELQGIQAVISADNSATKKRISNIRSITREAIDNMKQVYQQLLQANQQAFGSIADGVRAANALEWGGIPRAADLLKDLQDQVKRFERWRRELMQLQKRGLPPMMVAQLQEAGPEKEGILRGILKMTPKQIRQYVELWKKGQQDIHTATAVDFNNQLAQWRRHGRNAALQFMRGMRDEGSFINKEMKRIFLSWLRGDTRAQLPTGRQQRQAARARPPAPRHTRQPAQHPVRARTRAGRRTTAMAAPITNITVHEGNISLHGPEDLTTKHRKARLMQRNRRANRLAWGTT